MSDLSGLAGLVKGRVATPHKDEESPQHPVKQPSREVEKATALPVKRISKSKDPEWKGYSFILKVETHKKLSVILRMKDNGENMSDIVQGLVEDWVAKNYPANG